MKTNFALGITESGVTLWQRGDRGWLRVGAVPLDHDDMNAAVGDLVVKAGKLVPDDKIVTQLVIPDDQILYTRVSAPGPGADAQRNQIRKALEGRTPFPVEELDFDWTGAGPDVDVAVVARETLIEAEDFAKAQNLNPVCFVAAPASGAFKHAPFFGSSRIIRDILGDPAALVRDREILQETGIAELPAPAQKPAAKAEEPPETPKGSGASETPPAQRANTEAPKPKAPDTGTKDGKTDGTPSKGLGPASETGQTTAKDARSGNAPKAGSAATPATDPATDKKQSPAAAPNDMAEPPAGFKSRRSTDPAGNGTDATSGTGAKAATSLTAQKDKLAGASADAQKGTAGARKPSQGLLGKYAGANARISAGLGQLRSRLKGPKSPPKPDNAAPAAAPAIAPKPDTPARAPAPAAATQNAKSWTTPASATPQPTEKAATPAKAAPEKLPAKTTAPNPASPTPVSERKSPLETLRSIGQSSSEGSKTSDREAERLTVFGARGNTAPPSGSGAKSRLLIGGGVIMILAAAAVWAFYFARPAPEIPVTLAPPPEAALDTPAPLDGLTGTTEADAIEAALGVEDVAERGPQTDASAPQDNLSAAPPAEDADQIDNSTAPSIEMEQGRIAGLRSSALIMPQELSGAPAIPDAPQPFDAQSLPPLRSELLAQEALEDDVPTDIDAAINDAISEPEPDVAEATPALPAGEEALEIDVTSGRPDTAPPEKPVRFSLPETPQPDAPETDAAAPEAAPTDIEDPAPPADQPADAAATAAAEDAALPADDGALAAPDDATSPTPPDESDLDIVVTPGTPPVVPPARPVGVQPDADQSQGQAQPEDDEIQQAGDAVPAGGVALSALRPASRPSDLTARAEALIESQTPRLENATEQAVAASLRPTDRPSQFASTVQRALASTAAAPAAQSTPQAPVQTASAAAAQPSIPSSASVSREATQARAINLRQVNLIGVMGTSSSRRALVRLSNGRVMTVRVGESLDGGQVTAIGETELRYNRRGRDVVLRIAS